jgi:hypothetical protein
VQRASEAWAVAHLAEAAEQLAAFTQHRLRNWQDVLAAHGTALAVTIAVPAQHRQQVQQLLRQLEAAVDSCGDMERMLTEYNVQVGANNRWKTLRTVSVTHNFFF